MGTAASTRPATAGHTRVDSLKRAEALAEHLLDPARPRPVVVVTVAAGQSRPYIDVDDIVTAVDGLADVYVMPTGSVTFAMSDRLPEKTEVYGGAGRVYPVDGGWQTDPYAAPLRFAWGAGQGPAATDMLIADALGAAHAAGLYTEPVDASVVKVEGQVAALVPPSRALVSIDDGDHAAIWQDLLLPGVALERAFAVGMRVSGLLDVEQRRIDVSASLRKPAEALAGYVVGAVVLGRVVKLDDLSATVELFPGVRAEMSARDVTGNPIDRLTSLMSVGEVLPVRVTARSGHDGRGWRLRMLDVEDSEEILASPGLLAGGPPWLVLAEAVAEPDAPPAGTSEPARPPAPEPLAEPAAPGPTEALREVATSEPAPLPTSVGLAETLRRQVAALEDELARARDTVHSMKVERDRFREQASESYARLQAHQRAAQTARTALRGEKQAAQRLDKQLRSAKADAGGRSTVDGLFNDHERQFRFEVEVAYAYRIPAGDKERRPKREFTLGSGFLDSLTKVEGVDRSKVVDVTVDVITDLVNDLDGRELHPLREGAGAAERDVIRQSDGARCMRVALQRKTSSARRLHYWKVGEAIELSSVRLHDDYHP